MSLLIPLFIALVLLEIGDVATTYIGLEIYHLSEMNSSVYQLLSSPHGWLKWILIKAFSLFLYALTIKILLALESQPLTPLAARIYPIAVKIVEGITAISVIIALIVFLNNVLVLLQFL